MFIGVQWEFEWVEREVKLMYFYQVFRSICLLRSYQYPKMGLPMVTFWDTI